MDDIDPYPNKTTTPDTIRALIKRIYDSKSAAHAGDSLLTYVLLLGDAYDPAGNVIIPSYYGLVGKEESWATDSYYSFVSDSLGTNDFLADLYIGRIPVDTVSLATPPDPDWELRNVVTKITTFQPDGTGNKKMFLTSGGSVVNFDDIVGMELSFRTYFGYIMDNLIGPFASVDTLHRLDYPDDWGGPTTPSASPQDSLFSKRVADSLVSKNPWVFGYFDHGHQNFLVETLYALHYDTLRTHNPWPLAVLVGSETGSFDFPFDQATGDSVVCLRPSAPWNFPARTGGLSLDTCDVIAERLVLQEDGMIGVITNSRSTRGRRAHILFNAYMRALFEDNAYGLGDILLSTRLFCLLHPREVSTRALTLFGDPALSIMWENGISSPDSVDLSVSANDIRTPNDTDIYGDSGSPQLQFRARNLHTANAYNVPYKIWRGVPGEGTLLATDTLAVVPAHGSTVETVSLSGSVHACDTFYVVLDTTAFAEPTVRNNIARKELCYYYYQPGYPIKLATHAAQSITIANINTSEPGKELLFNAGASLWCYSAFGEKVWSTPSSALGDLAMIDNGTPVVANIYKDGIPYTLFLNSTTSLEVLDGTGSPVDTLALGSDYVPASEMQILAPHYHQQTMAVADLVTDDNELEILLLVRTPDYGIYIRAYSLLNNSMLWQQQIGSGLLCFQDAAQFAVGDLDSDGRPEVIIRTMNQSSEADSLFCLRWDLHRRWAGRAGVSSGSGNSNHAMTLVARKDTLEFMDIVATALSSPFIAQAWKYDRSGNGSLLFADTLPYAVVNPCLTAMKSDNQFKYIFTANNEMRMLDDGGTEMYSRTVAGMIYTKPFIADVNGNGASDIVTLQYVDNAFDPSTSRWIIDVRNQALSVSDSLVFPSVNALVAVDTLRLRSAYPAVDDIDDDGVMELAFISPDSVLHVIELGGAGRVEWGQVYGNPMQTNNYEQPMSGEYTVPVSMFNRVRLVSDVAFDSTLYVDNTARITIEDDDNPPGGVDSTRVEFRIYGQARFVGTEESPITITSASRSTTSDWMDIFVHDDKPGASATFEYCTISHGYRAISSRADITVRHCTIDSCEIGLSLASAVTVYVGDATITNCDVAAINVLDTTTLQVSRCTIEDNPNYGIEAYRSAVVYIDSATVIRNNKFGIHALPYGAAHQATTVSIDSCTIEGNEFGIYVYNLDNVTVNNCDIVDNTTNGILCSNSASITISRNLFDGNLVGIKCYNSSDPAIGPKNTIENGSVGIKCDDSSPSIGSNTIGSNGRGVQILNEGFPDLGGGGESYGLNKFLSNTAYDVENLNSSSTLVSAESNYWEDRATLYICECMPNNVTGWLDVCPSECDEPFLTYQFAPVRYSLSQNYPNPFNPVTTIKYQVPRPGANVSISIYNVRGQLVRRLVNGFRTPGDYSVTWEGENDRGAVVASGVYFLRMVSNEFGQTKKIILLK